MISNREPLLKQRKNGEDTASPRSGRPNRLLTRMSARPSLLSRGVTHAPPYSVFILLLRQVLGAIGGVVEVIPQTDGRTDELGE